MLNRFKVWRAERPLRHIWGNSRFSEDRTLDVMLTTLNNYYGYINHDELYEAMFDRSYGEPILHKFNRNINLLRGDGLIEEAYLNNGSQDVANRLIRLSGKGLKMCKRPIKPFKHRPYTYSSWLNRAEYFFFKVLPLAISVLALIIAALAYRYKLIHPSSN